MGSGTFDPGAYRAYTSTTVGKSTDEIYTARSISKGLDPMGVKVRESRDSADNPSSTPVIVALDVTGSMGMLADVIAREGLGVLFTSILERKPISDPHIMFMAVGDSFAQVVHPLGIGQCKDPIFEGAQGLLLDQDNKEFFPHVTRSRTGMHNVRLLCAQASIDEIEPYYVSRTYLTRHGAGPLPGEDAAMAFADDTNMPHPYQGHLRFAPLDVDSLHARCAADSGGAFRLVLTHCDQRPAPCAAAACAYGPTRHDVELGAS